MGSGYLYQCSECKREYNLNLGVGMMFPKIYKQIVEEIKAGNHGEEYQSIFATEKYAVVNASREIYFCPECRGWKVEPVLSLYLPNNINEIEKIKYGKHTVAELDEIPYITEWMLKKYFHLKKVYPHFCECGHRMRKASLQDMEKFKCPHCGGKLSEQKMFCWD